MSYADVPASIRKRKRHTNSFKCKRCANFEKLTTISTTTCSTLRRVARDLHRCNIESLEIQIQASRFGSSRGVINSTPWKAWPAQ
jgi:hypothetical protein